MRIGIIRRLRVTYEFFKALGDETRNTTIAVVHESGFVNIVSGDQSAEAVQSTMKPETKSARHDYEHKTT